MCVCVSWSPFCTGFSKAGGFCVGAVAVIIFLCLLHTTFKPGPNLLEGTPVVGVGHLLKEEENKSCRGPFVKGNLDQPRVPLFFGSLLIGMGDHVVGDTDPALFHSDLPPFLAATSAFGFAVLVVWVHMRQGEKAGVGPCFHFCQGSISCTYSWPTSFWFFQARWKG